MTESLACIASSSHVLPLQTGLPYTGPTPSDSQPLLSPALLCFQSFNMAGTYSFLSLSCACSRARKCSFLQTCGCFRRRTTRPMLASFGPRSSSLFSLPARSDRLCGTWFFFCRGEKSSSPLTWPSWPCSTSKQASCRFHYSPAGGPSRPHRSLEYPIPKPLCSPPSVASAHQSPALMKPPPNSPS